MRDFPLTDFDFWAFLTSGAVLLAAADRAFGLGWIDRGSWTFIQGALAVALAYVSGHVVAELASRLVEDVLVRRILGVPSVLLFRDPPARPAGHWLCPDYFRPIPAELRARVERRANHENLPTDPKHLYANTYIAARRDQFAVPRLAMFQNQYSMARNVSLACAIAAPMLAIAGLCAGRTGDLWWAAVATVMTMVMLLRFLKYYRLYSVEVLNAYAGGAVGA